MSFFRQGTPLIIISYLVFVWIVQARYLMDFFFKYSPFYADVRHLPTNINHTGVYCKQLQYLHEIVDTDYKPFLHIFFENIEEYGSKNAVIEYKDGKPFSSLTYEELLRRVSNFSCGLRTYEGGISTRIFNEKQNNGAFKFLGIYSDNSANWLIADMAAQISNITTVVMHSKFSIDETVHLLNETKVEWLCIGLNLIDTLLANLSRLPYLKYLIIMDDVGNVKINSLNATNKIETQKHPEKKSNVKEKTSTSSKKHVKKKRSHRKQPSIMLSKLKELVHTTRKYNVQIVLFDTILKYGQAQKCKKEKYGKPSFVASIVYTSGSSGIPKGVMLTNNNIYHSVIHLKRTDFFKSYDKKIHFSYLPISHIYEKVNVYLALTLKYEIHIWSKDIKKFSTDLLAIKPEILVGVPKVFAKIHQNITEEIAKLSMLKFGFIKFLLGLCRSMPFIIEKYANLCYGLSVTIKKKIDPELKIMINGGGSLSPKVEKDLYYLLNSKIYQGYGLTESTGPIFLQRKDDLSFQNVGGPISPLTCFRLESWESYTVNNKLPMGELQVKAETIFAGYFLKEKETQEAFTEDGFFKTGDIVQLNPNGSLTFLDRLKSLIKLSQGEYIEAETLNNLYSEIPFVNFCVVYGDDSMDKPIAIISINKELFIDNLLKDKIIKKDSAAFDHLKQHMEDEIVNTNLYKSYIKSKLEEVYKKSKLNQYNRIDDIYVSTIEWNTENYLTHTFKVRRFKVIKDFDFFIQKVKSNLNSAKVKI